MRTIQMVLLSLLIVFSLLLVSCADTGSSVPEDTGTGSESDDDGWRPGDETPPYAYAEELRRRLDPVIEDTFGIVEVEHHVYDSMGTYDVRYRLKNAPPHDEFLAYQIIHSVIDRAFDFGSFEDAEDLEEYVSIYGEEIPEHINSGFFFEVEGKNYYWEVFYDGEYIGFYAF